MYPHRCGVVPFKASIRSGQCFCCCWSADMPAQRLALITTIMAEVLMGQGAHRLDDFDRVAVCGARRSTWAHTNEATSLLRRLRGWRLVAVGRCQWTGR